LSGGHTVGVGEQEALLGAQAIQKYDRSFFLPSLIITTVRAIVKA
jgi:hypothetical protein